jgi:hypothetical protein
MSAAHGDHGWELLRQWAAGCARKGVLSETELRAALAAIATWEWHEEGVWCDEWLMQVLVGEREDRFRKQLEGLRGKGVLERHRVEPRVSPALDFGLDLSKARAAVAAAATAATKAPRAFEVRGPSSAGDGPRFVHNDGGGGGPAAAAGVRTNVTFKRLDVSTIKRSDVTPAAAASVNKLVEQVRNFVGDDDFARWWAQPKYRWVWEEPAVRALEWAYRYVQSGVASGEVKIRKTIGATLWAQFRVENDAMNRKAASV